MATSSYGSYLNNYYQKPDYNSSTYNQRRSRYSYNANAPTKVNYSGSRSYSQYTPQNSNSTYANYLKNEYANPNKLAANAKGETAYDLQRQRVQGDTEGMKQREAEDLQRRLAASGMDNSGMAFKQKRMLNKDIGEYAGRQMSDISTEELGAQERKAERLGEQAFESEEAGKERSESQRQFDSSQDIRVALQDNDNAMSAWKDGNKAEYDRWVEENNINRDDAERFWDTEMKERGYETGMSELLAGKDYSDVIAERADARKTETAYYHNAGLAGSLDDAALTQLQKDNPNAYMAYMAGKEGKSVEQATIDAEYQSKIQDALIPAMADPERNARYIEELKKLAAAEGFNMKFPVPTIPVAPQNPDDAAKIAAANDPDNYQAYYYGTASADSPKNYQYEQALKSAPVLNATIENKRLNLLSDMPKAGSMVNVNGRLMQVSTTATRNTRNAWDVLQVGKTGYNVTDAEGNVTNSDRGITGREADYFELIDLSTGKRQVFTGSSGDVTGGKSINSLEDWSNSLTLGE